VDAGHGVSVYGSVGQSFRAPALIELACADPTRPCVLPFALGDDPPLEPVVATTYEVGGTWIVGPAALTGSLYRTDVDNEIFLVPNPNPVSGSTIDGFFTNISKTRHEGVEVGANLQLRGGHRLYANYAWTRATFQTTADIFSVRQEETGEPNIVTPGSRLPLVPANQVKFGGAAQLPGRVEVGADVRWIGSQWLRGDEANHDTPLPSYYVADARVTWQVGTWEVSGLLTNVFNKLYANFGTFNINQLNPAGPTLERFLTPGQARAFRLVIRRSFGGSGGNGRGPDLD